MKCVWGGGGSGGCCPKLSAKLRAEIKTIRDQNICDWHSLSENNDHKPNQGLDVSSDEQCETRCLPRYHFYYYKFVSCYKHRELPTFRWAADSPAAPPP